MSSLQETPSGNRLHIGIFGRANSGKSSFINAFTGQNTSIVADVAGTTTDPVYKAMEISPLGPCVLIDTAGFDDNSGLGESRMEKTRLAAEKTDLAVILFTEEEKGVETELEWYRYFRERKVPVLTVLHKADLLKKRETELEAVIKEKTGTEPLFVSSRTGEGIGQVREALARMMPENFGEKTVLGGLVGEEDLVLLIMPQDIQAPKGRLILPQVQTLRELLDRHCVVMSVCTNQMEKALAQLRQPPKLIITDSQVFDYVYERKPEESMLTSFSVLFAAYKGDLVYYAEGAKALDKLTERSRVLIAECCTHAPLTEDIGRVKIPRMLRKRKGEGLSVEIVSGTDFPSDLSGYDLIIQCGGCMFNRKYVLSRIERARQAGIPMTNYGITIAHLTGILDKIVFPE